MDKAKVDAEIRSMFERIYNEIGILDHEDQIIREGNREYVKFWPEKLRRQNLINPSEHCVCFENGRVKWYWPSILEDYLTYESSINLNGIYGWVNILRHDGKYLKMSATDDREFLISKKTGKSYSESEVIRRMLKGEVEF